jgi:hypothetical protein
MITSTVSNEMSALRSPGCAGRGWRRQGAGSGFQIPGRPAVGVDVAPDGRGRKPGLERLDMPGAPMSPAWMMWWPRGAAPTPRGAGAMRVGDHTDPDEGGSLVHRRAPPQDVSQRARNVDRREGHLARVVAGHQGCAVASPSSMRRGAGCTRQSSHRRGGRWQVLNVRNLWCAH